MRRFGDRATPRFLADLGIETEVRAPGAAVARTRVRPEILGAGGGVRPGVLATLVDVAGGVAAMRVVGPERLATADLGVQVVRPLTGPVVEARATVVRAGRTTLVLEAEVFDVDAPPRPGSVGETVPEGPLGAWATMTFAILGAREPDPAIDVPAELPDRWTVGGGGFDRPVADALGIAVSDASTGSVSMPVGEYVHNSMGAVQGGVMALLGEVAGAAALSGSRTGARAVVDDLRLTYLALGRAGPIVSRTSVLSALDGAAGGAARVELIDEGAEGRLTTVVQVGAARAVE